MRSGENAVRCLAGSLHPADTGYRIPDTTMVESDEDLFQMVVRNCGRSTCVTTRKTDKGVSVKSLTLSAC